jgi:hypothetical protein
MEGQESTLLLRIILYGSWFGLGVAAYMAVLNAREVWRTHGHERRLNLAYGISRLGLILTLGLVTLRVIAPVTALPVNLDTVLYAVGVLMVGAGYLGIAVETRKVDRKAFK